MLNLIRFLPFFSAEGGGGGGGGAPAAPAPAGGAPAPSAPSAPSAPAPSPAQTAAFNARNHIGSRWPAPARPQASFKGEAITPAEYQQHEAQRAAYERTNAYRESFLGSLDSPFSHGDGDNKHTYTFADQKEADAFFDQMVQIDKNGLTPDQMKRLFFFDRVHSGAYENGRKSLSATQKAQQQQVAEAGGVADPKPGDPPARKPAPQPGQKPRSQMTVAELYAADHPTEYKRVMKDGFNLTQEG